MATSNWCQERAILESALHLLTTTTQIRAHLSLVMCTNPRKREHKWFPCLRHWLQSSKRSHIRTLATMWFNPKTWRPWSMGWTTKVLQKYSKTVQRSQTSTVMAKTKIKLWWAHEEVSHEEVQAPNLPMNSTRVPRCFLRVFQNLLKYWFKERRGILTLMKTQISILIPSHAIRI